MSPDADIIVAGGGPVGLACAIHARAAGFSVIVVERRAGVLDKACGEGLMPGALASLHRLGVDPAGWPLSGISYRDRDGHVDHVFRDGPGRGVRRTVLHAALAARARQVGVHVEQRAVTSVREDESGVTAGGVRGRWLLACDGLHSPVRRILGLDRPAARRSRRFGLRQHYGVAPWSDLVQVHWSASAEAYVTPVGPSCVGIAVLGPRGVSVDGVLAGMPDLAWRVREACVQGRVRGAGPFRQRSTARTTARVRLVGDASGYVDALTGGGLMVGLAQAEAAVAHVEDRAAYERAWRQVTRAEHWLTAALAAGATSVARPMIVPAARSVPWLYGAVVERLAGQVPRRAARSAGR